MLTKAIPSSLISKDLIKYVVGICKLKSIDKFRFEDDLVAEIDVFLN